MRLLLVEDEPMLARHVGRGLREEGFAVDWAPDGRSAEDLLLGNPYDAVVLDLVLPDRSGLELLEAWRRDGLAAPVLVLTARNRLADKIEGLSLGADDYLTKPFEFAELLARVRVLLRRRGTAPVRWLEAHDVRLDREGPTVERSGAPISLTAKEKGILELMLLHPNATLSRSQIAERVWDETYEARSNSVDVLVSRLRRKLEASGGRRLIHTVHGIGYSLRPPSDEH